MTQFPEESLPHFAVNTPRFPADKVSPPPQGPMLQDMDRKLRQAVARSPVLGAGKCKRMNDGLVCFLLILAIQ